MVTKVKCPACGTPVPWVDASRWRPFCSERCRTIDLGAWAANRHVIPGNPLEQPMASAGDTAGQAPDAAAITSPHSASRRDKRGV